MDSKSARRSSGAATMSTEPSSAFATDLSSSTRQSVPTPRQSHWNAPWQVSSAAARYSADSPFIPSVSRMAWRIAPG